MSAGLHLVLQLLHILESLVDNASCQHRLVIVPPEAKESLKQMEAQTFSHSLQLIHGSIFLKKNQLSHCGAVVPHVLQVESHFRKAGYHNIHCFYQNKGNSRVKKLHIRIWLIFRARKIMSIKQQILFYITIFWKCTCCVKNLLKGCVLQMFYKLQKSFGLWLQNMIQFYLATQE